jgi:hypothetical protein
MGKELNIIYRSDDNGQDSSELLRILNLAGMSVAEPTIVSGDSSGCQTCGSQDHMQDVCPHAVDPSMSLEDNADGIAEQADHDYGSQDVDEEGEEVDPSTYVWNGSKLPQRIVKGSQGDNPLISEIHSQLVEKYSQYLTEADRENEDGSLSPLSDPTKPEFDKDPLSNDEPVVDGSHSPMSTIARQAALK